jgi:hypothetical protein
MATADIEWHADPVPDFKALNGRPNFLDLAEVLVSENSPLFEVGPAFEHMQVRATDIGASDLHDRISRSLDFGIGHVFYADIARPSVDDSFHHVSPVTRMPA